MKNKKALLANSLLLIAMIAVYALPSLVFWVFKINSIKNLDIRLIFSGSMSVIVLGGVALIYTKFMHRKFIDVMKIKRISFKQVTLSMVVAVGTYIFAIGINSISSAMFRVVIKDSEAMSKIINGASIWILIIVVIIIPAIFEEIFFRGVLLDAYDVLNKKLKYFLITLIFATFHGNVMQIIYVMFLGIILLKVREYTDSLTGSMIFHATNNGVSLIVSGLAMSYLNKSGVMDTAEAINVSLSMALMRSLIFFLVGGTIIFVGLGALKNYKQEKEDLEINEEDLEINEKELVSETKGTININKNQYMIQYIPMVIYLILIIIMVFLQSQRV